MARPVPLRFATVGSVDDGKSTLIGRLLFDSKSIFEDQLDHVEAVSKRRGDEYVDLALVTDGLRAEREQGITIDVAYRYFSTPNRDFIIADTPGHIQYTRNMVTGASTADLAIVLIDARHGVVEQTRRHALLASLLGVPHLVICVNKMDLVDYAAEVFEQVRDDFGEFATQLTFNDVTFVPISALKGDNIVDRSADMGWYEGPTLLHHLETVYVAGDMNLVDVRFPVQYVIRPKSNEYHDYRGYAGRVITGKIRVGDEVTVLPSGITTTVAAIDSPNGPLEETRPPEAVTIRLTDDLDISRGDMICRPKNQPTVTQDIDAMICWMDNTAQFAERQIFRLKHTTRTVRAMVTDVQYRLDINTMHRDLVATTLALNDIGRVSLRAMEPLFVDEYHRNRGTGSFILIDETTNQTVAGGMIRLSAG